jgi:succinate dehydrogenase / fumarate reductase iron-sulfur subunit
MKQASITFRIFRYRPGDRDSARFEQTTQAVEETTTVLDVLETLHRKDRTLMFRHSCHHGSCGTCACRINGRERLACLTRVLDLDSEVVTIEPLNKLGKMGDLVVDAADFFREYPPDWQTLRDSQANPESTPPEELAVYVRLENCIECGACVSACPVEDFLGPAVLAGLNRERVNRERLEHERLERHEKNGGPSANAYEPPEHGESLLDLAGGERGVWKCQRALECSRVCPTAVYPARHIQELRNLLG